MVSAILRMFSQSAVLFGVLRGQKDGLLFALLTFASELMYYLSYQTTYPLSRSKEGFAFLCICELQLT
jgi:hypothetical protein